MVVFRSTKIGWASKHETRVEDAKFLRFHALVGTGIE
jgi:hypothetical protein